ncbi:MAG: exosome complex exonuclease Rrp41 [Candidatus Odinarchaeia archaeon]
MIAKEKAPESLITKDGLRLDGRKFDELRPIKFEVGVLAQADGSAYIEQGKNKIYAAVYGPRELHPRHLAEQDRAIVRCLYRMSTFSVSERKSPAPSRRETELSNIITQALEPAIFLEYYPRTSIDIFIQVIEADGGTRCASINAASLALANAGIPMRDLIVAVAAGKIDNQVILDLSDLEDKYGEADLPMAMLPRTGEIALLQMDGNLTIEEFNKAIELGKKGMMKIYELQREAVKRKYALVREDVEKEIGEIDEEVDVDE